jgi:hypothetical protein
MGITQAVVHALSSPLLFGRPVVVVATAVQPMLQLLNVCRVHEEEDDDLDYVEKDSSG